jgi:hypothetical protein
VLREDAIRLDTRLQFAALPCVQHPQHEFAGQYLI